jgi:NADH-quinone oxidoreductase subunit I
MPALKGTGLLKGLGVTFRTFTRPAATAQYPHVKPKLPARTRGVIALIEENCTVCMLCSRECPDWCIYIDSHKETVAPKEGGRARTRNMLDRFAIDFALCMYCGICVEVCPFDALYWTPEFEYAETERDLLTHEMPKLREWAYTIPPPDPLEVGAVEPKEVEAARKAQEAAMAKAAAAAKAAAPAAPPAARATPAGAGAPAPAARPAPQAEEVKIEPGIDQETFDRLVAAGENERTARAKAKAAYMRKAKAAARAQAGAATAEQAAPAAAGAGGADGTDGAAAVDTTESAVAAPETAPPGSAAADAPDVAEPAADARAPEEREPASQTSAATAVEDVHVEPGIDQETYDRLLAAGESDRTARAKAKAAYMRKAKAAARERQGGQA